MGKNKITEQKFKDIKAVTKEVSVDQVVARLTGVSGATVSRVRSHDDYKAYVDYIYNMNAKSKARIAAAAVQPDQAALITEDVPTAERATERTLAAQLERIATALESLVAAWESTPKKKRLF